MLIPQLRELESAGVFAGKAYPVVPPQVEYPLAKDGLALHRALQALQLWAASRKAGYRKKKVAH